VETLEPDGLLTSKRIVIVGCPGAGKSTLAIQLGELLHIPVFHLDQLWWRPGWVEAGLDAFDAALAQVVLQDEWIIDGNYSRTLDVRLAHADTALMLDFPRALCLYRTLKRALLYRGVVRPDMAPGCPEKVDWEFLRFVWDYPTRSRERVLQKLRLFGESNLFLHLGKAREVVHLLAAIRESRQPFGTVWSSGPEDDGSAAIRSEAPRPPGAPAR